jgi:hypothetical protein
MNSQLCDQSLYSVKTFSAKDHLIHLSPIYHSSRRDRDQASSSFASHFISKPTAEKHAFLSPQQTI